MKSILTLACTLTVLGTALNAQHPVVPGVERLRQSTASDPALRGRILLQELACTACHEADALVPRKAPDLSRIGGRVTKTWLRRFLIDPQGTKPGTTMPDPMPGLDAKSRAENVDLLVHYLASRGGPLAGAKIAASPGLAERGRGLFHSIGCVACHTPEGSKPGPTDVPLGDLARKTTIDELVQFLLDVKTTRPSARMPDLRLEAKDAKALAMYLLRAQLDNPQSASAASISRPGLHYDYYEKSVNKLPDFKAIKAVESGRTDRVTLDVPARLERKRKNKYLLRFRGELVVPEAGDYTLFIASDDGSRFFLDGELLIDNDGTHGTTEKSARLELSRGAHEVEIQFFEKGGGAELKMAWSGPAFEKTRIPDAAFQTTGARPMIPLDSQSFAVDRQKAAQGEKLFATLGCASCHEKAVARGPRLSALSNSFAGCLSTAPGQGAVDYSLSAKQRNVLHSALNTKAWQAELKPASAVRMQMAVHNCYACHERGGIGGVEEARDAHFTTKSAIDLGDEGRLPPPLNGIGGKLRDDALLGILAHGKHHIRARFMKTRMPSFDAATANAMTRAFVAADQSATPTASPAFDKHKVEVGRRIVGTTGFACVTCHNVNGNKSPAIQGVDIAAASARLRPDWFRRYLKNPMAERPGTRMPGYWPEDKSPFADLLGGSSDKQIEAVWSYLSLGKSMPPPKGVMPPDGRARMEMTPIDGPIVHRTFMKDVGPRSILCGFPENLHVAFDAHGVRMAKVWRGRFFDASGVSSGRTDKFLGPLSEDVLDLPAPSFAVLDDAKAAWPELPRTARNVGGDFLGYKLDAAGVPTFKYRLMGMTIEETPIADLAEGGSILRRKFVVSGHGNGKMFFLVWRGAEIEKTADGAWKSGDVVISLTGDATNPSVRQGSNTSELLLPIRGKVVRFEEVIRW